MCVQFCLFGIFNSEEYMVGLQPWEAHQSCEDRLPFSRWFIPEGKNYVWVQVLHMAAGPNSPKMSIYHPQIRHQASVLHEK